MSGPLYEEVMKMTLILLILVFIMWEVLGVVKPKVSERIGRAMGRLGKCTSENRKTMDKAKEQAEKEGRGTEPVSMLIPLSADVRVVLSLLVISTAWIILIVKLTCSKAWIDGLALLFVSIVVAIISPRCKYRERKEVKKKRRIIKCVDAAASVGIMIHALYTLLRR